MIASSNLFSLDLREENKVSTQLPLFPTATAKESSYAFIKRSEKFYNKAEYKILDGSNHHHANTLNKLPKHGKSNPKREAKRWFEIENDLVSANEVHRQNAYIVLLGEIYRFEIGNTQPKYRIFQISSTQAYPISEGVPGYVEFFEYFFEHMCSGTGKLKQSYEEKDLFEGMGRVVFNKFLYYEDDFHFGNMCLNKNNYFVGIDHDHSLAPLLRKLKKGYIEKPNARKRVQRAFPQSLNQFPFKELIDKKEHLWIIRNKNTTDMGEPNIYDYDNLPFVTHYLPAKWQFEWVYTYSQCLAKNIRFLNEKHFSLLKALITSDIKHALIDIHLGNDDDREKTHELIRCRFSEMESIATQSVSFFEYVNNHRMEAIKVILYEIAEFLNGNKHYKYTSEKKSSAQWDKLCRITLDAFNELLKKLKLETLSTIERMQLDQFSRDIYEKNYMALEEIQSFYNAQQMTYLGSQLQLKLDGIQANHKEETEVSINKNQEVYKMKLSRLATTFGAFAKSEAKSMDDSRVISKMLMGS